MYATQFSNYLKKEKDGASKNKNQQKEEQKQPAAASI